MNTGNDIAFTDKVSAFVRSDGWTYVMAGLFLLLVGILVIVFVFIKKVYTSKKNLQIVYCILGSLIIITAIVMIGVAIARFNQARSMAVFRGATPAQAYAVAATPVTYALAQPVQNLDPALSLRIDSAPGSSVSAVGSDDDTKQRVAAQIGPRRSDGTFGGYQYSQQPVQYYRQGGAVQTNPPYGIQPPHQQQQWPPLHNQSNYPHHGQQPMVQQPPFRYPTQTPSQQGVRLNAAHGKGRVPFF